MTRDDIIRMAREADLIYWRPNSTFSDGIWWMDAGEPADELDRFAALVAAAERAAILQMSNEQWFKTQADFEAAIRARNNVQQEPQSKD